MTTLAQFQKDLENMITMAIKDGISGSVIADAIVATFGGSRENAIKMVMLVGTKLNLEANPEQTWQQAMKTYGGIQ